VVVMGADDSRRLLHMLREGTALLVVCGDDEPSPTVAEGSADGSPPAAAGAAG